MALESNLNESPYFDDFDEEKNFHRVLFRPGYAVQARELTQLQSILQNQIERFAAEVVVDGTVISGCNISVKKVQYVRLRDRDANNRLILEEDFYQTSGKIANAVVYGTTSGVEGRLVAHKPGSEVGYPSTQTIYVDYINSGSNNTTKQFLNNEELIIRNYSTNNFIVAARTYADNATGQGLKASTDDGIIYHKGNFIRVEPQSTIAGRYSINPNISIGFESRESFVNSYEDSSLYDNASGSTNAGAPGADRLKITPTLTTRPVGTANTETFFIAAEIRDGLIVKKQNDTTYSDIGDYVDTKFFETNGNFAAEPFNIRIREHLKQEGNLGRFTAEKGGNTSLIVASIENGTGYVGGKRIKLHAPEELYIQKALTHETQEDAVIGQAIGNYVIVDEAVGAFDYQGLRGVELRNTASNAISGGNFGSQAALGQQIGTAYVRGVEWESGVSGTPTARYRIYLAGIEMLGGSSFTDVRSIYMDSTSGVKAIADVVLENGNAVLKDPALNLMVFPFTQKGTKTLADASNNIDAQYVFKNEKEVSVATNGTVTVTANSAHAGGTESMNDTGTLTTPDERNVIVVAKTSTETSNLTGLISSISTTNGVGTVTGNSTTFLSDYVVGDVITINSESATITAINSNTQLEVDNTNALLTDATGLSYNHKMSIPVGHIFDLSSRGTITSTTSSHTIALGITTTQSFNAIVQFNTLRTNAAPTGKVVLKNKFIKINTGTNANGTTGPWFLGVTDALRILKVYKAASGVTESDEDVTSHFYLDNGQKDSYYGTARLIKKPTSSLDLSSCELLVKFDYFNADYSAGIGFFTVDSYPVDDANSDASDKIALYEIPVYESPTSGKKLDLRDCVDFRPRFENDITPNSSAASAPVNPVDSGRFTVHSSGAYVPTPDENFQSSVQFYLPRRDRVMLNPEGVFEISSGVPGRDPKLPEEKAASMTLGEIYIPPYPSLSGYVGQRVGRGDYTCRTKVENNRRYTMRDIRVLDRRIKNVEYYSAMNALELSARNKQLFSDGGLDRFKNGFLVDSFVGHNVADTTRTGYKAAIDQKRGLMRPTFVKNYIEFEESSTGLVSSNMTDNQSGFGEKQTLTLNYSEVEYVSQLSASKKRNPVQELMFNWVGHIDLYPSMDNGTDINTLPDIQIDFSGMYDSYVELANRAGVTGTHWGDWETTNVDVDVDVTRGGGGTTTTTTTQTDQIRKGVTTTISPAVESFDFGNRVTNVAVRDYMREKAVKFHGQRMRPNTRVYAYFDNESVTPYITPANSSFANTASLGKPLITDENGNVWGIFNIPNNDDLKFRIGTREFKLMDIEDPIVDKDIMTTSSKGEYTSVPIEVDQQRTVMNIKVPQYTDTPTTSTRTLTKVTKQFIADPPPRDRGDPIAQTFLVAADKSDGIFMTSLDVFFAKKSSKYPITVQIREVENGLPTPHIVPFGSKTLQPSEINVSDNSTVATTFTFDSPIFLKNGMDYCFVLMPAGNNDEFLIWTAELGGIDVASGALITKQPIGGVMLTSSDDKSWSIYQKEDIKFTIRKAEFQTGIAEVYLQNKDFEFFTTSNRNGSFKVGEKVTELPTLTLTGVTGNSAGEAIAVGTKLSATAVGFNANATVLQVNSDDGAGTVSVDVAATYPTVWAYLAVAGGSISIDSAFSGSATADTWTAGSGRGFAYYEDQVNGKLHLVDSNGGFTQGEVVAGQVSGAYATIDSIYDMPYNSIVPKIPAVTYSNTSISWTIRTTGTSGVISDKFVAADNGGTSEYLDNEKKVFSRSNEVGNAARDGTNKSIIIKGLVTSQDKNVTPIIDLTRLNALMVHNIINNDASDEQKESGNAEVRHISKIVELADGNEAEDLKVFVTAWRPSGTDVKVYARLHNPADPESIYDKDFTEMTLSTSAKYSDSVNRNDFKELEFSLSANTDGQGFLSASSANNHARLNTSDDEVVWYMNSEGSKFRTYKNFAIKIVLTSGTSAVVPLVADMRAIALQK